MFKKKKNRTPQEIGSFTDKLLRIANVEKADVRDFCTKPKVAVYFKEGITKAQQHDLRTAVLRLMDEYGLLGDMTYGAIKKGVFIAEVQG